MQRPTVRQSSRSGWVNIEPLPFDLAVQATRRILPHYDPETDPELAQALRFLGVPLPDFLEKFRAEGGCVFLPGSVEEWEAWLDKNLVAAVPGTG